MRFSQFSATRSLKCFDNKKEHFHVIENGVYIWYDAFFGTADKLLWATFQEIPIFIRY